MARVSGVVGRAKRVRSFLLPARSFHPTTRIGPAVDGDLAKLQTQHPAKLGPEIAAYIEGAGDE
jgi:hypothetical protein